jgi:hypothetical protein
MRRRDVVVELFAAMMALATLGSASAEDTHATPIDYTEISPVDLVKSTPKGKLVNPYKDTQADIVAQGERLFQSYSCGGCHGGGGGGGMGCQRASKVDHQPACKIDQGMPGYFLI